MTTTNEDAGLNDEQIETAIDAWFTYDEAHAHDFKWRMRNALLEAQALAPSKVQVEVVRAMWQPIETAPKTGCTLLLGYPNALGKWRTVRGQWMSEAYIAESWEEPDDAEPGWYETSAEADDTPNCWYIEPTHWMPLPKAPDAAAASGGEKV